MAVPRAVPGAEIRRLFDDTVAFWRDWFGRSTYTGRWREELLRSAITLKLMTHAPSGGVVAARPRGFPSGTIATRGSGMRHSPFMP